jgi:uncharacterized protein
LDKENIFKVIDSHMHLGVAPNVHYYKYSDERVIELERQWGCVLVVCSHCAAIFDSIHRQEKLILEASKKFGDFIYWNIVYDPNSPKESLGIIESLKGRIFFAGIKIHPVVHGTNINDEKYYPLWEYAASNDIVISSHTWSPFTDNPSQVYGNPLLFEDVLYDYPDLKVILGHSGGKRKFYQDVFKFAAGYENVYLDFSGDCIFPGAYESAVATVGDNKVLFGTDMPMMDIRFHYRSLLMAKISDRQRERIFHKNATELYKFKTGRQHWI